ncbi:SAM-dependent methyltransferase [Nocardioides thalensis]|uniref:SAM-dependent methyltransferase n=1 Tax=Nocardioides thalensis TaxID=1914755 RepID=A0A853BZN6_9ACTN|nr:class I SAM-dependent methyltransferase [Nocardioides thalensis]NYJ01430.1 SAM-dependent methyltransferase [Nocardioides thalensis]
MTAVTATAAAEHCHACGGPMGVVRHSVAWHLDVGRCRGCGTVSVLGAAGIVAEDIQSVASGGEAAQTDWEVYADTMHTREVVRHEVLDELRARAATRASELRLFDVGAGTGGFLDMARSRGFRIAGNDISQSAVDHAAARYGIELSTRDLDEQPAQSVDVLTMWCVIAHVGDPSAFLASAWRMLRPGGVLFLRTPRWCLADAVGVAAARVGRRRLATLADQRVTRGHLHLYRDRGMERMLDRLGYVDVDVQPVTHTGCTGAEIASRLGASGEAQQRLSRVIDRTLSSRAAPRNTMFVYARRPGGASTGDARINDARRRTSRS